MSSIRNTDHVFSVENELLIIQNSQILPENKHIYSAQVRRIPFNENSAESVTTQKLVSNTNNSIIIPEVKLEINKQRLEWLICKCNNEVTCHN